MALHSGVEGTILVGGNEIGDIRGWSFAESASNPQYASNKTGGYKKSVPGVKHAQGSFSYALDTADPLAAHVSAGSEVTLELRIDAANAFVVPAVIDRIGIEVDIDDTGDVVGGPVEFTANGEWTQPTWT